MLTVSGLALAVMAVTLLFPEAAYASGSGSGAGTNYILGFLLDKIRFAVNRVGIPLAILVSGWKIAYLAVVCGIMGIDPLSMMPDGSTNWQYVFTRIKLHLTGFVKGLAWISSIALIFNTILFIVQRIALGLYPHNY